MFTCDHKNLKISFTDFHDMEKGDLPEEGWCFLELKDGSHTAGNWMPGYEKGTGEFIRGQADVITMDEVSKWHILRGYDLTGVLEKEATKHIILGEDKENAHKVVIQDFKSFLDGDFPKEEQYCLLIMKEGRLAAGRWKTYRGEKRGYFLYASALASHEMDKIWAWTELSTDRFFAMEEERAKERMREEELNRNPSVDPEKFRYGTDINVYYEKALEKLRSEYPWASMVQMKKERPWEIVALHGKYVFGQSETFWNCSKNVKEWSEGNSADEFIDFLCEYTKETVQKSDPAEKFKYGKDIEVYLEKAYEKVKKDYRWLDKKMLEDRVQYAIKQVDGDWEYLRKYQGNEEYSVCDYYSADRFIEGLETEYQSAALEANPVVAEYEPPFESVDLHGWCLEKYVISKLQTGDYKVYVQAGDRSTGGSREFFITPYCFEADSYEEFLDRYLQIVPGGSFGLYKEDLISDAELKSFFGY